MADNSHSIIAFYAANVLRGVMNANHLQTCLPTIPCFTIICFVTEDAKFDYAPQMNAIIRHVCVNFTQLVFHRLILQRMFYKSAFFRCYTFQMCYMVHVSQTLVCSVSPHCTQSIHIAHNQSTLHTINHPHTPRSTSLCFTNFCFTNSICFTTHVLRVHILQVHIRHNQSFTQSFYKSCFTNSCFTSSICPSSNSCFTSPHSTQSIFYTVHFLQVCFTNSCFTNSICFTNSCSTSPCFTNSHPTQSIFCKSAFYTIIYTVHFFKSLFNKLLVYKFHIFHKLLFCTVHLPQVCILPNLLHSPRSTSLCFANLCFKQFIFCKSTIYTINLLHSPLSTSPFFTNSCFTISIYV